MLSCLWDDAYRITLAAIGKDNHSIILSQTEEPAKVDTCAHERRALQMLALNVHVKHVDLDLDPIGKEYPMWWQWVSYLDI